MGISDISKEMAGKYCPHYRPNERVMKSKVSKHDSIKDSLRDYLKKINIPCEEEYAIDRGRVDIFCEKEDLALVIEVKSYPLLKFSYSEYLQLVLYMKKIKKSAPENKKICGLLVFSSTENSRIIGKPCLDLELPKSYDYIVITEENLDRIDQIDLDIFSGSREYKKYYFGTYCDICEVKDCPIKRGQWI